MRACRTLLARHASTASASCCSVQRGDEVLQLVLYATEFALLGRRYKLVSFQNIRDELEKREIESWQKLIRVLTHEIMNSVTPIISLSKLIQDSLWPVSRMAAVPDRGDTRRPAAQRECRAFAQQRPAGIRQGLPQLRQCARARDGGRRCAAAAAAGAGADGRGAGVAGHRTATWIARRPDLLIHADPRQIEQVLINLVRNAAEALAGQREPQIRSARCPR